MPGFTSKVAQAAIVPGGGVPQVRWMDHLSTETYIEGAILTFGAGANDHLVVEAAADPVAMVGIALHGANKGPGFDVGDSPTVITGREVRTSVAIADGRTLFGLRMVNGATDPVTPVAADVGRSYGAIKTADGTWAVDQADVTLVLFRVERIDIDSKLVFCSVVGTKQAA